MILRALTLWPEWAWAVCHLGKDVENRSPGMARVVRNTVGDGWLAIHAGKHIGGRPSLRGSDGAWQAFAHCAAPAGWQIQGQGADGYLHAHGKLGSRAAPLYRAAIVAVARVSFPPPPSLWANSGLAQIGLYDVRTLPSPVPCSGKQGLWTVPADLSERVLAQVTP